MRARPSILMTTLVPALLAAAPAGAAVVVPTGFMDQTLVSGLDQPNSMAFLPDGRLLFTEQRTGRVRMVVNRHIAAADPVLTIPDVNALGLERGLQGIAVDPGWPARPYVYVYYTRTGYRIRVTRYTASGDLADPSGENLALADSLIVLDYLPDDQQTHNAGCLRFGPDGMLYVSTGDDGDECGAADSTRLKGVILRVRVSTLPPGPGGPAPLADIIPGDNPLATTDSLAMLVWAYGMRNPWRFHIDPVSGVLYATDVGDLDYEEINEVLPGDFLGWPWREGPRVWDLPACPEPGGSGANQFKAAILAYPIPSPDLIAFHCAGMYRPVPGAPYNFPAEYAGFYGDVFYGEYYRGFLRRLKKQSGVWGAAPPAPGQPNADDWATGLVAAVDFQVGPDGGLWWLQQFDEAFAPASGSLHRIHYAGPNAAGVPPGSPASVLAVAPTPFADRAEVSFTLAVRGRVRLSLHDPAGREVRRLLEGEAGPGTTRVVWDGADAAGRPVAAGVYLARLEAAGRREAARLVRVSR